MKLHDAIRKSDSNGKDNSAIRYIAISWAAHRQIGLCQGPSGNLSKIAHFHRWMGTGSHAIKRLIIEVSALRLSTLLRCRILRTPYVCCGSQQRKYAFYCCWAYFGCHYAVRGN